MKKWGALLVGIVMWGGTMVGLAYPVLTADRAADITNGRAKVVPSISLSPNPLVPGRPAVLHIDIPPGIKSPTYGYTARLQERTETGWEYAYTLYLGMRGSANFEEPGFSKKPPKYVFLIGFGGTMNADVQLPPLSPGSYRVVMNLGRWPARDYFRVVSARPR